MTVVKGPAAGGQAGIFGNSTNPLSVYMQYQNRRAQTQYLQQQDEKKNRDQMFEYVGKYNPEAKWEPFNKMVNDMAQSEVRDWAQYQLNKGVPANQMQSELAFRQGGVRNFIGETQTWKEAHDRGEKAITGDIKYTPEARTALNDIFFQPNGAPRNPEEIRKGINDVDKILYDPKFYNRDVVTKKFMDTLPEQAQQTWGSIAKADGTLMTSQEVTGKLPYQRDAKGEVILDPHTQKPLMKMTDELYTLAKGNQDVRLMMETEGGPTRAGQEAWLAKNLPGFDKTGVKNLVKEGFKKTADDRDAEGITTSANERFKNTEKLVNDFRPDLLSQTFDPYKDHKVEYVGRDGLGVVSYDKDTKTYTLSDGSTSALPPKKIRVSFTKGGVSEDMQVLRIQTSDMSPTEKKDALAEIAKQQGKLNTQEFDITTKQGKRTVHHVLNRLLDEYLPPKQRLAESYTKTVNDNYDDKPAPVTKDDPLGLGIK